MSGNPLTDLVNSALPALFRWLARRWRYGKIQSSLVADTAKGDEDLGRERQRLKRRLDAKASIKAFAYATAWAAIAFIVSLAGFGSIESDNLWIAIVAIPLFAFIAAYRTLSDKYRSRSAKAARCTRCGADYAMKIADVTEDIISSTPRVKREGFQRFGGDNGPTNMVKETTWMEDSIRIKETYRCLSCGNQVTKEKSDTRSRDWSQTEYAR